MFTPNIFEVVSEFFIKPLRVDKGSWGGKGFRVCMRDRNGTLVEASDLTLEEATELSRRIQPPESLPGYRAVKKQTKIIF